MKKCLLCLITLSVILVVALAGCGVTLPQGLYMYAVLHDGNLKGTYADARTGANALALGGRPDLLVNQTNHAVAFISVNATDCIANIPTNFGVPADLPIYNADGTVKFGDNWADLLDGSLDSPLTDAIMPDSFHWWSGSKADGTYDNTSTNCSGWTSNANSGTNTGFVGSKNNVATAWMHLTYEDQGNINNYVLCIAYHIDE